MSLQKISQLADEFVIKLAEEHYETNAPKDVKSKDITWITPEEHRLIKENGTNPVFLPHNPPSSVANEAIWNKAKKAVKKHWKKYDEPWAVVYDVYYKMGGKKKKKDKK